MQNMSVVKRELVSKNTKPADSDGYKATAIWPIFFVPTAGAFALISGPTLLHSNYHTGF
jgi:hypothetical protein